MENKESFFPRYIDRPRLIGIFEMDEFFLTFFTIMGVIAASFAFPNSDSLITMLIAFVTGISVGMIYKKFKNKKQSGYTLQYLYRKGLFSPHDNKKDKVLNPYLNRIGKVIPYGFTKYFYN
jgi:type IV conjugative transfer system protein TraL